MLGGDRGWRKEGSAAARGPQLMRECKKRARKLNNPGQKTDNDSSKYRRYIMLRVSEEIGGRNQSCRR